MPTRSALAFLLAISLAVIGCSGGAATVSTPASLPITATNAPIVAGTIDEVVEALPSATIANIGSANSDPTVAATAPRSTLPATAGASPTATTAPPIATPTSAPTPIPAAWEIVVDFGTDHQATSLAIDPDGNLFVVVAGPEEGLVEKLRPDGSSLGVWSTGAESIGSRAVPVGIAIDSQGVVYVVDRWNAQVLVYSASGDPLATWGEKGSDAGQFSEPRGIAIDAAGNVYVVDSLNSRVQKLSSEGEPLAQFGGTLGDGPGQLNNPAGVAVDGEGNVYVTEIGNSRIQKFAADGASLAIWGSEGGGPGQFEAPIGIALDTKGNLLVADSANHRVQMLSPAGAPLGQWGSEGGGVQQLQYPYDVAVSETETGVLYVADLDNERVMKVTLNQVQTAIPTFEEASSGGPDILAISRAMSTIQTYRTDVEGTFGGRSVSATTEVVLPDRTHTRSMGLFGPGELEVITVQDRVYARTGSSEWLLLPADEAVVFLGPRTFDQMVSNLGAPGGVWTDLGTDTVLGERCHLWQLVSERGESTTICIDGANRVRHLEQEGLAVRFYDFNIKFTIEEPTQ